MDLDLASEHLRPLRVPPTRSPASGWLEVVTGPMFSGKTEELIRRLRRASLARQTVAVFQPSADHRFRQDALVSHASQQLGARAVASAEHILEEVGGDVQVVGIDEAQFFGPALVPVVERLADAGRRVLVAGLDQDFTGAPFAPMPELMALAERVTKVQAICMGCGLPAGRTFRKSGAGEQVLVGAGESYEARCRACHRLAGSPPAAAWAD